MDFDSMGRNLDNFSKKFLMYPMFIQVFLDKQIDGLSNHERKYVSSSHIKKNFGNMRRIMKGFSRRITPLFPTMVVQLQLDEAVHMKLGDSLVRAATTASSLEAEQDSGNINRTQSKVTPNESSLKKLVQVVVPGAKKPWGILLLKLGLRVVLDLEKTKTTQANVIDSLKRRVKKLERRNRSRTHKLKRLYRIGLTARADTSDIEESLGEDTSKQRMRIDDIDADEDITLGEEILVDEPVKPKKKDQIRLDEEAALKLQAKFDEEQRLTREKAEKELKADIALIETWDDVQAKLMLIINWLKDCKQKNNKNKEDVAIDAIPLAVKSPGIVVWKIYKEGKKSYYQIIRDDGKSKMYMFFSQMLTSFDREDLEDLYKLVKAKFRSTRPVEDLDLLLWGELKTMFEPHIEDEYGRGNKDIKF
nr:hypothetical protein [Tanacetum cinerariifolium]